MTFPVILPQKRLSEITHQKCWELEIFYSIVVVMGDSVSDITPLLLQSSDAFKSELLSVLTKDDPSAFGNFVNEPCRFLEDDSEKKYEFRLWCWTRRSTCLFWIYVCAYLTYLIIGGLIFSSIEAKYQLEAKKEMYSLMENFLNNNTSVNSET